MPKLFTKTITNLEDSRKLAQDLHDNYLANQPSFTLFLEGGLGAGKTFMVREILHCFGVAEAVSSPTYALVNEYEVGDRHFSHFDFYRLSEPNDFFARGFTDIAEDVQVSHFVEWPDKISNDALETFSGKCYTLHIELGSSDSERQVTLLEK